MVQPEHDPFHQQVFPRDQHRCPWAHPGRISNDIPGKVQPVLLVCCGLVAHVPDLAVMPDLGLLKQLFRIWNIRSLHHLLYFRGRPGLAQFLHVIRPDPGRPGKGGILAHILGRHYLHLIQQAGIQRQALGLKASAAHGFKLGNEVVVLGFQQSIELFLLLDRQQRDASRHFAHGVLAVFLDRRPKFFGKLGILVHDLLGDTIPVLVEEVRDIFE